MTRRPNPNRLLVEGSDEVRVVPHLIEANGIRWEHSDYKTIVDISDRSGIENILKPGAITAELKTNNLQRLGILVDADTDAQACWARIRARCIDVFPRLPDELPIDGVIAQNYDGQRLGIWIMPDNRSGGMLETFLAHLVPAGSDQLWQHAQQVAAEAKLQHGAAFKDAHRHKAEIHTWLAWQDPPGQQLHNALMQHILDPRSPYAAPFVAWFRALYQV